MVASGILAKYAEQGLDLSLRQLYYQLIATAYKQLPDEWIDPETGSKNNEKSYKKIGDLINNARLAGLLDWDMLTDRGRVVDRVGTWDDPVDRLEWAAKTHRLDKWADQPNLVWVMIEKQALEGVMVPVCRSLEVPFIANKDTQARPPCMRSGANYIFTAEMTVRIFTCYILEIMTHPGWT